MSDSSKLVSRVKEYLAEKHEVLYCKGLHYNVEGSCHELKWDLNQADYPMIMVGDFVSEDDFFNYICKEIDRKKFFWNQYFIARRVTNSELQQHKTK